MTPHDEAPEDALTRDYRRESAADAGRPSPATRAAILAEARAASQRHLRASKTSRLPWAVAASVTVLGIAITIWHQTGPQQLVVRSAPTALDQPPAEVAAVTDERRAPAESLPAPVPTTVAAARAKRSAGPPPALAASAPAVAKAEDPATRDMRADATDSARFEGAAPARTQSVANASAAAELSATGLIADAGLPAALLKQQFPVEYASATPPHTLWLLRDANGAVLRSGTLRETAALQGLDAELQRAYPGQHISAWNVTPLVNARGAPVSLAMATLMQ